MVLLGPGYEWPYGKLEDDSAISAYLFRRCIGVDTVEVDFGDDVVASQTRTVHVQTRGIVWL